MTERTYQKKIADVDSAAACAGGPGHYRAVPTAKCTTVMDAKLYDTVVKLAVTWTGGHICKPVQKALVLSL